MRQTGNPLLEPRRELSHGNRLADKTDDQGNADRGTDSIAATLLVEVRTLIDLTTHLRNQVCELVIAGCRLASDDIEIGANNIPRIALNDGTARERRIPGANGSGVDGWQI